MKRNMKTIFGPMALMLLAAMVFASCKDSKQKQPIVDEEEENEEQVEANAIEADEKVEVSTAREFLKALKSNTHIIINNDEPMNLTDALDELIDEGRIQLREHGSNAGGLFYTDEYDGNSLVVAHRHDIIIEGKKGKDVEFIVTPSYADVIRFEHCKNIMVKNITMGHKVTGGCSGDVLVFSQCKDVEVDGCNLYGCGVNGLTLDHTRQVNVKGTHLYGCSDDGVQLINSNDATFTNCSIYDNGGGVYVDEYCDNVLFEKSDFHGNRGQLFYCHSGITLKKCNVEHHHDDITDNVKFRDCEVVMDYDDAEEYPEFDE